MFKREFIEVDEECWICGRIIPDGHIILRHIETNNIICLICIAEIASVGDEDTE
jgi:hypothetical protein